LIMSHIRDFNQPYEKFLSKIFELLIERSLKVEERLIRCNLPHLLPDTLEES